MRILCVLVGMSVGSIAWGQTDEADLRSAFVEAYDQYETAIAASDLDAAAVAAERSLSLGIRLFGEINLNTASLRQNQALVLELQGRSDEAEAEYLKALDVLEALQEADSLAAIPVLTGLGKVVGAGDRQSEYLQRALTIQRAAAPDDVLAYVNLAIEVAELLSTSRLSVIDLITKTPPSGAILPATRLPSIADIRTAMAPGRALAGEILSQLLDDLETTRGEDSPDLVPVLLALGRVDANSNDDDLHLQWAERAVDITEKAYPDDAVARANVAFEVGRDLLQLSESRSSESFLEDALRDYEDVLGSDDERTAAAAMWLGEARFGMSRFSRAERPLITALEFFGGREEFQAEEFRIRTMLSEIYLRSNKSDDATPHLIELGRLSVFSEQQEYLPIYKVAPVYPPAAFQRGLRGRVILEYTVTASGQTENVRVIESTDPVFDRASIESAERYRYIPRVIDGEPVEVNGVTTMIVFDLQP